MRKSVILLLDDDPIALHIRCALLQRAGYTTYPATNPAVVFEILRAHAVDLVITGQMLRGTTGTAVAACIHQFAPSMPIVILTGAIDPPDDLKHVTMLLSKLEAPEVLLDCVHRLLQQRCTA